jgi:hypothetical protein
VTQSTTSPARDRAVLCQCGNELSEFAELLAELAMPIHECTGALPDPKELEGARLAVVSGRRLLEGRKPNLARWPRTIAVIDDSSKTLVTHLGRIGVAMVIRRPIHPRALRLLLLHEIYRGPERRVRKRVLVGHRVRVAAGLFRPPALLLELSPTGARIELPNAPKVGSKIRILLGKDLTKSKPVKLNAKVVRCIRPSDKKNRMEAEIGVVLLDAQRNSKTIKTILERFALGPAKWKAKSDGEPRIREETRSMPVERNLPPTRPTEAQPPRAIESHEISIDEAANRLERIPRAFEAEPDRHAALEEGGALELEEGGASELDESAAPDQRTDEFALAATEFETNRPDEGNSDRRREERVAYSERVVALDEEAARVLVGRDLSPGGMRIAANESIRVGDTLRVALHSGTQSEPLVVIATAHRDDGDDGIVLTFDDLSESQCEQLSEIIRGGPAVHASMDETDDLEHSEETIGESIVVAEMLETINPQSDAEISAHLDSVFDTSESVENAR